MPGRKLSDPITFFSSPAVLSRPAKTLLQGFCTAVPPYPWGICFKTPGGCLKPQIVQNPIYICDVFTLSYVHTHTYDKV